MWGRTRNLSQGMSKNGCDSVATADKKEAKLISAIATQNQRKIFTKRLRIEISPRHRTGHCRKIAFQSVSARKGSFSNRNLAGRGICPGVSGLTMHSEKPHSRRMTLPANQSEKGLFQ